MEPIGNVLLDRKNGSAVVYRGCAGFTLTRHNKTMEWHCRLGNRS